MPKNITPPGRLPCIFFLVLALFFASCSRKTEEPPPETVKIYMEDADRFCRAVVKCLIEDTEKNLVNEPEKARFIAKRMNQELCLKEQYLLVGRMSVDPFNEKPEQAEELYRQYSFCSKAVAEAPDCRTRKTIFSSNEGCIAIKRFEPHSNQ